MDNAPTHFIKVRQRERKTWAFLARGGSTNRLRIHAVMFTEARAKTVCAEVMRENVDYFAKIVPMRGAK